MMKDKQHKLHACSLGLALGIVWGAGTLLIGLAAWQFGYAEDIVELLASAYLGYEATPMGSLIGAAWGFVDAFIGGVIIAWVYNWVHCCCCKMCKK